MKINFLTCSWLALLMFCTSALTSCSKDSHSTPEPEEEKFNIHHPEGYFISIHTQEKQIYVMKFVNDRMIDVQSVEGSYLATYTVNVDNEIVFDSDFNATKIKIIDGKITKLVLDGFPIIGIFELKKIYGENALAGNLYKGYYKINPSTFLHPNFFYEFNATQTKVSAGLEMGTVLRTGNYRSIGNFAAFVETPNYSDPTKMDKELLVWMDGNLEANYYNVVEDETYFGVFTKQ